MTDTEIAAIIFNETRSLSGDKIQEARVNIAHAVYNGDKLPKRPISGSTTAKVPKVEQKIYDMCVSAVAEMRLNISKNTDPTDGATNFNFRKNDWRGNFFGKAIKTQIGPLGNSYPTDDLPASGIYANTYK
jgi:hypothetical protein